MTDDRPPPFAFPSGGGKNLITAFDGGRLSSDGGVMLLATAARRTGIAQKLAAVIPDGRDPTRVVHPLAEILLARMLAIACGYADADDLDALRTDPAFKLACGRLPESGANLMSQPTVSRWENAPASTTCPCCGGSLHLIGEDVARRLDVVPAQYRILVTRRPKYACRGCEGTVVQAPAPARLIEGGLPTERLVAQVLVDKYADHCPLYRQVQGFARQGIELDRSTLAFWTGYAAAELKPLWRWVREELLQSGRLFVDETRAPVLDPGRGRTKTGYLWAIARDDRGCNGSDPPAVVYSYAPGRGADHAIALLKGFSGILQTDGYGAYKTLVAADRVRGAIALAYCWAHARRRFFELAKGGATPIADEALRRIAKLYAIEAEIRGQDADTRKAARQARSRPLVSDLKLWLEARLRTVAGRSPMAEAIRYTLTRWEGLTRFLDDGRIELDSNPVERSIRPIALNRKNALFAGSDEGAENWAVLATLIECCKLHGVNPHTYLTDVLTRLVNGHLARRLGDLTPWAWQAANNGSRQAPAQG